ncbi:AAA family ATPase, partial [Oscillatoria laete-virens NRMC-F 0139]
LLCYACPRGSGVCISFSSELSRESQPESQTLARLPHLSCTSHLNPPKKNGVTTWNYKYEQVFVLTHSLYFFYEITETKHDERKETQKLFRLIKNDTGSYFEELTYESIKNDYQAYWHVIKDPKQHPALIANCMRNIIEYFFNFIENKDLNNFFLQPTMKEIRFQSFYRYINRESHSLGQNIFDFKEFDYQDFKDAFEELFKVAGYEDHYKKMIS